MGAIYLPGNEPENIRKKLDSLFEKLDTAYPDKLIKSLHKEHKKWGEALTKLYRELGYQSGNALLEAYGYTVVVSENVGGKPSNMSVEQLVEELKNRYIEGPVYDNLKELLSANSDIAPYFKKAQNNANELFGMTFSKYLISIGVLAEKTKKVSEVVAKEYNERPTAKDNLAYLLDELTRRYSNAENLPKNISQLKQENSDLPISTIDKLIEKVYDVPATEFLTERNFICKIKYPTANKCNEILKILIDHYGGDKPRLNHVNNFFLPITNEEKKYMVDNCPKVYGFSFTKLLEREGVLFQEYKCPQPLTSNISFLTKLNGERATFTYNVDTQEIRRYINLIYNNWSLTNVYGDAIRIPLMATPESEAAFEDAKTKTMVERPKIITIDKEKGLNLLTSFLERCAEYTKPEKIKDALSMLPRKNDGSVMLKKAVTLDWSQISVEKNFFELIIIAKNNDEIEMRIRQTKCDFNNLNRIKNV